MAHICKQLFSLQVFEVKTHLLLSSSCRDHIQVMHIAVGKVSLQCEAFQVLFAVDEIVDHIIRRSCSSTGILDFHRLVQHQPGNDKCIR